MFNWFWHIRWFGTPSLYECITGELYDNKFKDLPVARHHLQMNKKEV